MPYIGRDLRTGAFRQLDDISSGFDGSDTTHTMQVNSTNVSVGDVNQILLSLGGVIQKPGTDFTVSGSTLTFTTAPAANTSFFAILLGSDNGGTVTPTDKSVTVGKIDINGGELFLDADDDTSITADTDDQIDFKTGGTDRMHIASDGDVLISKTSNAYQTTGHEFLDGGRAFHTADGGKALSLVRNSSNGAIMDFYNSGGSEVGSIETAASGIGIKLGGTAAANLLDDYEEGTYNPTLTDSAGNVTSIALNSSFDTLAYTKVGRKVTIGGAIVVSSFSGSWGSGQCQMSLPFVVANLSEASGRSTGTIGAYQIDFTAGTAPYLITSEGNSYCVIQTSGDNSTGGAGQPTNSAQLYVGLTYFTT